MTDPIARLLRRLRALLACAAFGAVVAGCGSDGGVGTGGTGSLTLGPISGFGSIIVNGIRYDDDSAAVFDGDGNATGRGALRVGMVVEVQGSGLTEAGGVRSGRASTIRYASEVLGPVGSVGTDTLVVLGQTVRITPATVFEPAAGLAALRAGDVVEVHGFASADPRWTHVATRVEVRGAVDRYVLRGFVRDLRPGSATFRLGGVTIAYAQAGAAPADGQLVRVRLLVVPRAEDGAYVAQTLRGAARSVDDRDEAEIQGLVTAFTSPTRFSIDGIPVDASRLAVAPAFPADPIGRRIEVDGRLSGGVLIAEQVDLDDDDDGDLDDDDDDD